MNDMITSKDISVIVQGAVDRVQTTACLCSIRKVLPGAEVILSTWEGAEVTDFDVDIIVLNQDPGSSGIVRMYPHKQVNNVNRQIVSTLNGLKKATRPYCMKIRSDMLLKSDAFLKYYNSFHNTVTDTAIFSERVMVEGITTNIVLPFVVGDWWYLGKKEDLINFFDIPLYKEEYMAANEKKIKCLDTICKYPPEQYITYSCLKKRYSIEFDHWLDINVDNMQLSKKFIFENLICLETNLSGVCLPKASNMINLTSCYYGITFIKWYRELHLIKKFPQISYLKKKYFDIEHMYRVIKYLLDREFQDKNNYINIIKNYAKLDYQRQFLTETTVKQEDVTFIISGVVEYTGKNNIMKCIRSVKKYFPRARIMLSVWDNADLSKLDGLYDDLIINRKQDNERLYTTHLSSAGINKINSSNMQQWCMHVALEKVQTPYSIRLRSDFCFENGRLFDVYNKWIGILDKTDVRYRIFEQRILTLRIITRDARQINGEFVYQLSDLFQFGLTKDLLKLWNGDIQERGFLNYFKDHPESKYKNPCKFNHLFTVEQSFLLQCIKNSGVDIKYPKYYLDNSLPDYIFESEKIYVSNFILVSQNEIGLKSKFDEKKMPFRSKEFWKMSRFVETYLLNIDPKNEACLQYLRKCYKYGGIKHGIKKIALKMSFKRLIKRTVRKMLHYNPSYRMEIRNREEIAALRKELKTLQNKTIEK